MKKLAILLIAVLSLTKAASQKPVGVSTGQPGWQKIGETTVNFKMDRDEIISLGADRFSFIKFQVKDAPVHLVSAEIHFEGGGKQNVTVGSDIKAPGESRTIQLDGAQSLKKVVFIYKTTPNYKDKKAHVELWGLLTK